MLSAESPRPYSWWWDSHLSPKYSKWLQENLTDMDAKIKAMLKLVEEDADSFAKRAEMYYKKRPELVNLVEEFYRAYRALAERYDHISGELRQVHYTIAEAFPNQIQNLFPGDSPQASILTWASDQSFESPQKAKSFINIDEMPKSNSGQKNPFQTPSKAILSPNATEEGELAKSQGLKQINEIIQQYRNIEKKALQLQEDLNHVQEEKRKMKEDSLSQVELINSLKEQLFSLKKINKEHDDEGRILRHKLEAESEKHQNLRTEIQNLKVGLQNSKRGHVDKGIGHEDVRLEHGARDHIIVSLQDDLNQLQQENNRLNALVMTGVQRCEKAEEETQSLRHALSKAHAEQETLFLEYQNNLNLFHTSENMSKDMQVRLVLLQEENNRLNDELSTGALQLKVMEDKANNLERDKNTVQQDMGHLIQKTNSLIEELASMRTEEKSLRIRLQDETDERRRIDIALRSCQQALSVSQEQQEKLTAEIQLGTETLQDADRKINFLQGEVFQLEKQNGNMVEQISSASVSIKNLEEEISKLKQVKSDLSNEVAFRIDQRNALQQELYCLQEERNDLDRQFQTIKKQIEPLGLDTNSLHSSFVNLRNDNQQLMKLFKNKEDENLAMANITKGLEEELVKRSAAFENLVSSHTIEVERLKDDIKKLQLLLQDFQEEKVTLMAEREQHGKQRSVLEINLHDLENRFSELEKENLDLNSKLNNALGDVGNLSDQLHFVQSEKEKNQYEIAARNAQIRELEKQVSIVQAERNDLRIKMQEETEKQEKTQSKIGRLEKLLEQTQDRNTALSNEFQKHSEELVAVEERLKELEKERQTQKMKNVSLEKYFSLAMKSKQELKIQIHKLQNMLALPDMGEAESEGTDAQSLLLLNTIIEKVKIMQADLSTVEDANKKLSNAASAMSTYVEQLNTDTSVLRSEKKALEEDAALRSQYLKKLQEEHTTLQQAAESLRTRLQASEKREKNLEEEAKNLQHSLASSENAKLILQDEHQRTLQDCISVKTQITEMQGRFCIAEQEGETLLAEILTQISLVTVLESNIAERNMQIQQLLDWLMKLDEEKKEFENEVKTSSGKLQILDVEVQSLRKSLQSFEEHKRQGDVLQNEFNLLNEKCEQVNLQLETDHQLIKEKDTMLDELRRELQVVQEEKTALVRDMENMKEEHARGQMTLSELRLQVSSMTEEILHLRQAESNLEEEVKNLQHSLLSSHDAHLLLQDEHQRTLLDYNSMRTQIDELKGRFSVTDQENTMLLVEALTQMNLLTVLESNALQRDEQVQQLVWQLNKLQTGNMELENKVQTGSGKLQMLELDVQKLHELMQRFNEEKRTADTLHSETKLLNEKCEQMNLQLQSGVDLLREKDKMLGEFRQQLHTVHDEKKTLLKDLESAKVQHISSEMTTSELRLQVSSLTQENICLKQELSTAVMERAKAKEQLNGLQRERETLNKKLSSFAEQEKEFQNDVKKLQEEEEVLRCQLQKQTEHSTVFEQEVEKLHESLQLKEIRNVLLIDENQKIYSACKLLEAQRKELEEDLLSMKQEKKKQNTEEEGRIAQIRELERNIVDVETKKSIAGAVAIKILGLAAPLKNDLSMLRELVLDQMTALKMDTQKLQDFLLDWHQDATSKMQKTNMELSLEAQSQARKVQKLQADTKHIIAEREKKNQKLEDEYHVTIEKNCDVMAGGEDIVNGKIHLELENSSLKMELHERKQKASQLQEERNAIEDELHLQEREVESLKSKLEETKELYMQVLKLLELVIGPDSNHVSLNIESFQFAEDKLKEIYKGMYCLRQEDKKLKDDTMHMSCKIDKLEDAGSSNKKELVNNRQAQLHNQGRNLQQKSQQIEAENWLLNGAMPRKSNEERNSKKYVTLEIGCKNGINNAALGKKEKMLFQRHVVEAADSHVCRDEALLQMQGSVRSLEGSEVDENNNILEETEHFQEKYTRLERQVQELNEKAKMFDAKSQEAQDLAMKLEELQPSIVDSQKLKERLKELQAHIKSLQQENIHLKEISHGKEVDFVEVESSSLQEEKEVVVDESKGPINTSDVIQEIDIFQEENRKNWGRLDFVTKKVQNLQNAIQELQRRSKSLKQKNKKLKDDRWWKGLDYNSLEKQLRELQGQVKQLVEHNSRLRKDVKYVFACMSRIQEDMSGHEHKFDEETLRACQQNAKIAERLEISSEKARILESEVQRIRVTLARFQQQILDDVPKIKVPLRAFLVGSRREHPPKKQAFCACVHPPPTRD